MKTISVLIAAVLAAGALTFLALHLSKSSAKSTTAAAKIPGIAVNLIACGQGQQGTECIAIYKGQCAVFLFNPQGKLATAQPVQDRYCRS